jgi:inorganic triphosphatase YgiF
MSADRQEIEWQYEVSCGLEEVEEWLGGCDPGRFGFTVLGGSFKELEDTYYDTEDWRLYRSGWALRVRQEAMDKYTEATMKSLESAESNLHRRREISEPLRSSEVDALHKVPGPVGIRLRTLLGPRGLCRIFGIRTRRQTFDMLLDEQEADNVQTTDHADTFRIGEVVLDSSEILGGNRSVSLSRVEVEVDASATTAVSMLENFVEAMEKTLGLRPTAISKYEAGLSMTGQSPKSKASFEVKAEEKE